MPSIPVEGDIDNVGDCRIQDKTHQTTPNTQSGVRKSVKLRCIGNGRPTCLDRLHAKSKESLACSADKCLGSVVDTCSEDSQPRSKAEILKQAHEFIDEYYTSNKGYDTQAHKDRWTEIENSITDTGTYKMTYDEITFGAKTAWRNAPRCIGRIQWSKLMVFDARHVETAKDMFEAICTHMEYATNKGNIRSAITIFPQRTDGNHDFRIWNAQLIRYAGYKQEDGTVVGDPVNIELTQIAQSLDWTGKGTQFDVLPLILQANGQDPELFEIPSELILEVKIKHPHYPSLDEMGLRWYALPTVSNMVLDCGGLQFTAAPFNGWYMGTEIGARNFCDKFRYNLLEDIAKRLGFDTFNGSPLWKDRTLVEINEAVLYSFQTKGVTITDHHAASDSFMKHLDNEQKLRGGCPADWVWIVPPISGSILSVFHQEMLNYKLKPSYEYQVPAWRTYKWQKTRQSLSAKQQHVISFKALVRAIIFSTCLMGSALARRVKCTILYASETGKSKGFACTLCQILSKAFSAKVICMDEYNVNNLTGENLVLVVTSTFGNGDPPENGESFCKNLTERLKTSTEERVTGHLKTNDIQKQCDDTICHYSRQYSNVRYSVFALGSSSYPHFCAFGHNIDTMFHKLGAERIYKCVEGDELYGQEEAFKLWAKAVFKSSCDAFCVGDDNIINEATSTLSNTKQPWMSDTYRIIPVSNEKQPDFVDALSDLHGKNVFTVKFKERIQLQSSSSDRQTMLIKLSASVGSPPLNYQPGDHVAIFPENPKKLVDAILNRLHNTPSPEQMITVEMLQERSTPLGSVKTWKKCPRLPPCTLRTAFSKFTDITTPPSQSLLKLLATQATRDSEKEELLKLATDSRLYLYWIQQSHPNIAKVMTQFSSLRVPPSLLLSQLPLLKPRFYSISSSPKLYPGELHITVAVVMHMKQDHVLHEGLCSNWLRWICKGSRVPCFISHAASFHMPDDETLPMILVGSGTGIAPFRSFWQERKMDMEVKPKMNMEVKPKMDMEVKPKMDMEVKPLHGRRNRYGDIYQYFGCRNSQQYGLYQEEMKQMKTEGVLKDVFTALSRDPGQSKTYVQTVLRRNSVDVYHNLINNGGHIYVCGDVKMASDVTSTLEDILAQEGNMTTQDARKVIQQLQDNKRFHTDIFGPATHISEIQ